MTPTRSPSGDATPSPSKTPGPSPSPTSDLLPTPTPTLASPTPAAVPTCAVSAVNLVQNAGFESVGTSTVGSGTVWRIYEPTTTEVPGWTRRSPQSNWPSVLTNPSLHGLSHPAFEGAKYAVIRNYTATLTELRGTLSPSTDPGATYRVTARIATDKAALTPPAFEVWLGNSSTGARSTSVVGTAVAHATDWTLLSGTVTATGNLDQIGVRQTIAGGVVLSRHGLVDDVHVCLLAGSSSGHPFGGWALVSKAGASVLAGVIFVGLAWHRWRRVRAKAIPDAGP